MNRNEMLQFMNANPVCCLATVENGQPRVRGMLMYRADEQGILFHTASFKDLYRQVQENPLVEVCFHQSGRERPGSGERKDRDRRRTWT